MIDKKDLDEAELQQLVSLSKRILWTNHETRRRVQKLGVNIVPANFYSEIPTHEEIDRAFEYSEEKPFASDLLDENIAGETVADLAHYSRDFNPPVENPETTKPQFYWKCPAFSSCDAMAYYAMIRKHKPANVLEIGSGYSTLVACDAAEKNGNTTVTCIEPFPKDWLKDLDITLHEKFAQDISAEYIDKTLSDGDVLFIDSTHTVKCGSDVVHLFLRVLPYIKRRLFVHVHDIYLPYGLPKSSLIETQIYWTEQYLLLAYLLDNPKVRFLFSNVITVKSRRDAATALMHDRWAVGGSSFWFEINPDNGNGQDADVVSGERILPESPSSTAEATTRPSNIPSDDSQIAPENSKDTIAIGWVQAAFDDERIPDRTRVALKSGRYEFKERELIRRMLSTTDKVIELGGGMGVVSSTIAHYVPEGMLKVFEANPVIAGLARENLKRNGSKAEVIQAIASPRKAKLKGPVEFFVFNAFEASSVTRMSQGQKAIQVPVTVLEEEIVAIKANVLVMDIEGFERDIILQLDFSGIDKLIFESHPKIIGREETVELIRVLEAAGLNLRKDLVFGDVVAFDRAPRSGAEKGATVFARSLDYEILINEGDFAAAEKLASELDDELGDNAYFNFRRAQVAWKLGKDGIPYMEMSAANGSGDFHVYSELCSRNLKLGRRAEAQSAYDRLLKIDPSAPVLEAMQARLSGK